VLTKDDDVREFIEETIVKHGLGIYDATKAEIDKLVSLRTSSSFATYALADMISRRAQIGVYLLYFRGNSSGPPMDILPWM
jgi:hypothetical protein